MVTAFERFDVSMFFFHFFHGKHISERSGDFPAANRNICN